MTRLFKIASALVLLVGLTAAPASEAAVYAGLAGSVNMAKLSGGGASYTSETAIGYGGAIFGFNLGKKTTLEFNALYSKRSYSSSGTLVGTTTTLKVTTKYLEFPVLVRFWPIKWLSLGAGGYYAKQTGSVDSELTAGGRTTTGSGSWSGKKADYGVLGSVSLVFGKMVCFYLDGRYYYGLANASSGTTTVNWQGMQGLVGALVRF